LSHGHVFARDRVGYALFSFGYFDTPVPNSSRINITDHPPPPGLAASWSRADRSLSHVTIDFGRDDLGCMLEPVDFVTKTIRPAEEKAAHATTGAMRNDRQTLGAGLIMEKEIRSTEVRRQA
jgi:hypothetical protein